MKIVNSTWVLFVFLTTLLFFDSKLAAARLAFSLMETYETIALANNRLRLDPALKIPHDLYESAKDAAELIERGDNLDELTPEQKRLVTVFGQGYRNLRKEAFSGYNAQLLTNFYGESLNVPLAWYPSQESIPNLGYLAFKGHLLDFVTEGQLKVAPLWTLNEGVNITRQTTQSLLTLSDDPESYRLITWPASFVDGFSLTPIRSAFGVYQASAKGTRFQTLEIIAWVKDEKSADRLVPKPFMLYQIDDEWLPVQTVFNKPVELGCMTCHVDPDLPEDQQRFLPWPKGALPSLEDFIRVGYATDVAVRLMDTEANEALEAGW